MTKYKVVDLPQKKIPTEEMDDILQEIRIYIQTAVMNILYSDVLNQPASLKKATKHLSEAMALIDDTRLDVFERYGLNKGDNS